MRVFLYTAGLLAGMVLSLFSGRAEAVPAPGTDMMQEPVERVLVFSDVMPDEQNTLLPYHYSHSSHSSHYSHSSHRSHYSSRW